VDDGSTDNTAELLDRYGARLRPLRGRHAGAGAARNLGISAARGDVVAFLDSDDEWRPNKLALQRALFETRPDVLFCFTDFGVRADQREHSRYLAQWHGDQRGWDQILGAGVAFSTLAPLPPGYAEFAVHVGDIQLAEMRSDYIATFTMAARRRQAGAALHFAEDVPTFEDWECFGRLAAAGKAAYLDCETVWNYGHAGPRLTDADTYEKIFARLTILERVWGQDRAFLAEHGADYALRRNALYQQRARWLLCRGRTREARADLRRAGTGPLADRMLASLPGPVAWGLCGLRRLLRH
jgi:glycosyltransferase involved in cell wall biosynthesis